MSDPILPTRVISGTEAAKSPAPPPPPAPPVPPAPYGGGEHGGEHGGLPWGPPPPPRPVEVYVTFAPAAVEPEVEPNWRERLWVWVRDRVGPYGGLAALVGAVVPIPGLGYGVGPIWGSFLYAMREDVHPSVAYVVGLGALVWAGYAFVHHGGARRLFALAVTLTGAFFGVLDPFDLITVLTGVSS